MGDGHFHERCDPATNDQEGTDIQFCAQRALRLLPGQRFGGSDLAEGGPAPPRPPYPPLHPHHTPTPDGEIYGGEYESAGRAQQEAVQGDPRTRRQPFTIREHGSIRPDFLGYPLTVTDSPEVLITADRVPEYAHPGDAGADLHATERVVLAAGQRATVGTGVSLALPDGYVAFVVPRSGLAFKHGITLVNAPGTVDAGYRGEIRVSLLNTDATEAYTIEVGDRIAQVVIMPVSRSRFVPVERLPGSARGEGGFGSTGFGAEAAPTHTTGGIA